jgi:hypothetical protein
MASIREVATAATGMPQAARSSGRPKQRIGRIKIVFSRNSHQPLSASVRSFWRYAARSSNILELVSVQHSNVL